MKAVKQTERKYYKYSYEGDNLIDLSASNNQSYINTTTKKFTISDWRNQSTTQTYVLNEPIYIKDLTTKITGWVQQNALWVIRITATTDKQENISIINKNYGYNGQPNATITTNFDSPEQLISITIYCLENSLNETYSHGGLSIGFTATTRVVIPSTSTDYDFYKDEPTYEMVKEIVRKYYKYGTTPNVTLIGSPTVNNGVISGFSANNVANTPEVFAPGSNTWEQVWCFTTGSDIMTVQRVIGKSVDSYEHKITLQNGTLSLALGTGGSSWNISNYLTIGTLSANTKYWLKIEFTGSQYNAYLSTNGTFSENPDLSITSSSAIGQINTYCLGNEFNTHTNPWLGSIDLTQSYIKINNKDWWHGTLLEETTEDDDYDFYKDVEFYYTLK